jgi:ribonuclease HI
MSVLRHSVSSGLATGSAGRRVPAPHFKLRAEAAAPSNSDESAGRWRFVLLSLDGRACLEAEDDEPETSVERLQLLAIVRALESLDEPARVTLLSPSRSISRGIRDGLAQWRENDWQWERYGKLTPVKNGDLWRRIDRAMAIHEVVCRDAPGGADDLAGPPNPLRETVDVRVIHRVHRNRRLRIDPVGVEWNSISSGRDYKSALPRRMVDKSVLRSRPPIRHWWDEFSRLFAGLLRRLLRPSGHAVQSQFP